MYVLFDEKSMEKLKGKRKEIDRKNKKCPCSRQGCDNMVRDSSVLSTFSYNIFIYVQD